MLISLKLFLIKSFTLNKIQTDKIVYKIKKGINRENYEDLYEILNDYARERIEREAVVNDFKRIVDIVGSVESYSYSSYDYQGEDSEQKLNWHIILYDARFGYGKGTIKLTISETNEEWSVAGIKIELNNKNSKGTTEIEVETDN